MTINFDYNVAFRNFENKIKSLVRCDEEIDTLNVTIWNTPTVYQIYLFDGSTNELVCVLVDSGNIPRLFLERKRHSFTGLPERYGWNRKYKIIYEAEYEIDDLTKTTVKTIRSESEWFYFKKEEFGNISAECKKDCKEILTIVNKLVSENSSLKREVKRLKNERDHFGK